MNIFEYNEELHIQMERADAREEGYAEGRADGILTGQLQVAKAMLEAKDPLEIILKYSGLSPEVMERLEAQ